MPEIPGRFRLDSVLSWSPEGRRARSCGNDARSCVHEEDEVRGRDPLGSLRHSSDALLSQGSSRLLPRSGSTKGGPSSRGPLLSPLPAVSRLFTSSGPSLSKIRSPRPDSLRVPSYPCSSEGPEIVVRGVVSIVCEFTPSPFPRPWVLRGRGRVTPKGPGDGQNELERLWGRRRRLQCRRQANGRLGLSTPFAPGLHSTGPCRFRRDCPGRRPLAVD